ncbi:MAG: reactive intermediate/imine deaminase [Phycisphaerales bacterium]|nr:reactive intermediate/imine deaminase [Phycisphaerales bacterium]
MQTPGRGGREVGDRVAVAPAQAPAPIGPYSPGIRAGGFIFCSGQTPIDPETGRLVDGDVGVQTRRAIENLRAVLRAAGSDLDRVVKTTVYLKDLNDFEAMNEAYGVCFAAGSAAPPARTTIEAARLPRDARVEIECIALA